MCCVGLLYESLGKKVESECFVVVVLLCLMTFCSCLVLLTFYVWKHVKEVRLSHTFLAVGRVDVRVEDSRVRQGVESFKPFFFCVF